MHVPPTPVMPGHVQACTARYDATGVDLDAERAAIAALRRQGMSPLGIGCAGIGSLARGVLPQAVQAVLALAAARDVTLFDTAASYGGGVSERTVGRHAAGRPGTFVVTKLGRTTAPVARAGASALRAIAPVLTGRSRALIAAVRAGAVRQAFAPDSLDRAMDASLARLRRPRVEAVLLHSPAAEVLRTHDLAPVLARFLDDGRADHVGVSCDDHATLRLALDLPRITLLQMPLALYRTAASTGCLAAIRRRGIAIVLRGVVSTRSDLAPAAAVAQAGALPGVVSVIVGVSSPAHLADVLPPRADA